MVYGHDHKANAAWLGPSLRELRDATGMTLVRAGEFLQRNAATVSRFESGEYPIRRPDLMALLDLYGVSDRRKRDGLLRLSEDVWQKGWWDGYEPDVERQFVDFVWLESRATEIRSYDPLLVTGLLQTREYAEAVITTAEWEAEPAQIARWVHLRMDRQTVLNAESTAPIEGDHRRVRAAPRDRRAGRTTRSARAPARHRGAATCGSPGAPGEYWRACRPQWVLSGPHYR